jgi:hypothetical protein
MVRVTPTLFEERRALLQVLRCEEVECCVSLTRELSSFVHPMSRRMHRLVTALFELTRHCPTGPTIPTSLATFPDDGIAVH